MIGMAIFSSSVADCAPIVNAPSLNAPQGMPDKK
jgi:hypothetical protein